MANTPAHARTPSGRYLLVLSMTALGIVFGDIGTSPLYAFRESFHAAHGIAVTPANVLGVLSLIFWSLLLVIGFKYMVFVMHADNHGEGGILALTALITPARTEPGSYRWWIVLLGLFGAALLYGDGIITPAISVLSAVEGLNVATHVFEPYVLPLTIVILLLLFTFQYCGTARVGALFGPVTLGWFLVLAALGIMQILYRPGVLMALNPWYALDFFVRNAGRGFLVLGSVFLVVTGGEALYADMGHFGIKPIRLTWFVLVFPALLLNYFGQGALLIGNPDAIHNPFFLMAPRWALYPLVILSTLATVIASQAVISGAFSLTRQAVHLGYLPRLRITQTSYQEIGQVYIPSINWILMVSCTLLVFSFKSSSNLAAAYGVAVTMTMVITTLLFFVLSFTVWQWSLPVALLLSGFFLIIDLGFFGANILKIPQGGWFPLVLAAVVFVIMTTWKRGRELLAQRMQRSILDAPTFIKSITDNPPTRVPGTAVFMSGHPKVTPPALLANLRHNHILHEKVVFVAVTTEEIPRVHPVQRETITALGEEFYQIVLHFGFMDIPDVPTALENLVHDEFSFDPAYTTYFFGRETLIVTERAGMAIWREKLFTLMSRNARSATAFFGIPTERIIELGVQVEL